MLGASTGGALMHAAPEEYIQMSKYRLLWEIDQVTRQPSRPEFEWAAVPAAAALASFTALVSADFKAGLGLTPEQWRGGFVVFTLFTLIATIALLIWCVVDRRLHPRKTTAQIVEDIIDKMEREREQHAAQLMA